MVSGPWSGLSPILGLMACECKKPGSADKHLYSIYQGSVVRPTAMVGSFTQGGLTRSISTHTTRGSEPSKTCLPPRNGVRGGWEAPLCSPWFILLCPQIMASGCPFSSSAQPPATSGPLFQALIFLFLAHVVDLDADLLIISDVTIVVSFGAALFFLTNC